MFQRVSFPSVAVQMIFVLSLSMPLIAQSSPTIWKATSIASESSDAVISQTSIAITGTDNHELPDAPWPQSGGASSDSHTVSTQSAASIAGTVLDAHGIAIPGVQVTLAGQNSPAPSVVTVDSRGAFAFARLLPGTYTVTITLPGGTPSVAAEVALRAGEKRDLPIVTSGTPTSSTTVHVTANMNEVAEAQVKEAEKQRILGVVPNFYTSYIWNSAPMTPRLKFQLALRSSIDPVEIIVDAGVAGAEQWHNTFPGYGPGWEGYGQRFGAAYADTVVGAFVGRAILPTILHQDPRYFYRGSGSIHSRVFYALEQTFVTRGDNGQTEPNYSHFVGNFATAGIANIYRAPSDRTAGLTLENAFVVTAGNAVGNLLREFLSRPFTTNVPAFAKGKH